MGKKHPVWNNRIKDVIRLEENCKKMEKNGFGPYIMDTLKGMHITNMEIDANIIENTCTEIGMLFNVTRDSYLGNHLNLLGMSTLPVVSKHTQSIVRKYIISNLFKLDAFSLHYLMKKRYFPCVKSIIFHNDFIQRNTIPTNDETILSNDYVIGFHGSSRPSGLIPSGFNYDFCQQRDCGFWGKGAYLSRDIAQALFYMISYAKLASVGLEENDCGIIFMYAASKKNLTHDVAPSGKTVGLEIPENIDYRLSDMGSEAVFTRRGISKLFLVATIEMSIKKINENVDLQTLLNDVPDYFKGDRLETPRYD